MIYLDNSATTKPYEDVLNSYVKVSTNFFGNPSSLHTLGGQSESLLHKARELASSLLEVKATEVIFTSGGTESNNLAIKGIALAHINRGKHIITSTIEHPSVSEAFEQLKQLGFKVTLLPVDNQGRISVKDVSEALTDETILVSIMHVNNEVGTIQPIEEIGDLLTSYPKVSFHVDHVQGFGKVPLHLKQANIDLCSISGHKFHALKGTGLLYVREGVDLHPIISGGSQESALRSGTENVAGIVAMTKAMRIAKEKYQNHIIQLQKIKSEYMKELTKIPTVHVNTPTDISAPHIINFSINGLKAEVFVHMLASEGIYVSTTSACSSKKQQPSKTLLAMGYGINDANSAVRISLSYENKKEEVKKTIQATKKAMQKLQKVMR